MRLCAILTATWIAWTAVTIDAWIRVLYPPRRQRDRQAELDELDTLVGCRSDNGARACVP